MRAHHVVIAILILAGVCVKAASFASFIAESEARSSRRGNIAQQNFPAREFNEMTFVFPTGADSN
ncbi:MAG: hypothetical protein J0G37_00395 [Afipia sp.]|jgi:hypothetical protein|nr:hypothetical protein [Afipia sp.]